MQLNTSPFKKMMSAYLSIAEAQGLEEIAAGLITLRERLERLGIDEKPGVRLLYAAITEAHGRAYEIRRNGEYVRKHAITRGLVLG